MTTDEVLSLVLEVGSHTTKLGFSGTDTPTIYRPSSYQSFNSKNYYNDLNFPRESAEIIDLYADDYSIKDSEGYKSYVKNGLSELLHCQSEEQLTQQLEQYPLMFVEQSFSQPEQRKEMAEWLFEECKVPAIFFGKSGVLSAFSAGRSSALVMDFGHSHMTLTPVYEGYALKKSVMSQPIGGKQLTEFSKYVLQNEIKIPAEALNTFPYQIQKKKKVEVEQKPDFVLKKNLPAVGKSFLNRQQERLLEDFKESVCSFSEMKYHPGVLQQRPSKAFEFPNGYHCAIGKERFLIPEALLYPEILKQQESQQQKEVYAFSSFLHQCLQSMDSDIRQLLLSNLILTGGSSLFPQSLERMTMEANLAGQGLKTRIYGGNPLERKFGSWIGGSILSSLGTFQSLWVSKQEYEESGPMIFEKRSL